MRAEDVTKALRGKWYGRYGMARCPAHDDNEPSLSIANGEDGKLLLKCHAGCGFPEICARLPDLIVAPERVSACLSRVERPDRSELWRLIEIIWSKSQPVFGTHAEDYLRARAILGPVPDSLRFNSSLRHPSGAYAPAMVARIDVVDRNLTGLHRTYLDQNAPAKSKLKPAKAMLGKCAGGAVRLRFGTEGLVVCEGIETGLSLCDAFDGTFAVWAALSTSGMTNLNLPEPHRFDASLMVAMDGDDPGHRAGLQLADRAFRIGWVVETMSAPPGLDFNDLAQGGTHD